MLEICVTRNAATRRPHPAKVCSVGRGLPDSRIGARSINGGHGSSRSSLISRPRRPERPCERHDTRPPHRVPPPYLLRIVSALRSIFFSSDDVRLPLFSCWEARAFALRAWALSGIGYLRSSGSPYCESLSLSRSFWSRSGIEMALRGRTTAEHGY